MVFTHPPLAPSLIREGSIQKIRWQIKKDVLKTINTSTKQKRSLKAPFFAVWTGLEPATLGVTGRYSNQTELPHQNIMWFYSQNISKKELKKVF